MVPLLLSLVWTVSTLGLEIVKRAGKYAPTRRVPGYGHSFQIIAAENPTMMHPITVKCERMMSQDQ